MKKYIGTKVISAEPQIKDGKCGYQVVHEDGYTSWSPIDVFEKAYHEVKGCTFWEALAAARQGRGFRLPRWLPGISIRASIKNDANITSRDHLFCEAGKQNISIFRPTLEE